MSDSMESSFGDAKFSISACKKVAKDQLKGRKTTPVLATLIIEAIAGVIYGCFYPFSFFLNAINNPFYTPSLAEAGALIGRLIPGSILLCFFVYAAQLAYLKIFNRMFRSNENQSLKTFFTDFKYWWKAFRAALWQNLWIFLWELAIFASGAILIVPGTIATAISGQSGIALFVFILGMVIFYVYAFVALMWKALQYSMHLFILADDDNVGVIEALRISRRITKGFKWKLFVLMLSFIGWYLLSILTFGILQLWITPYYEMSLTNAFMFMKRVDNERYGKDKEMEKQGAFVTPNQITEETKE